MNRPSLRPESRALLRAWGSTLAILVLAALVALDKLDAASGVAGIVTLAGFAWYGARRK